MSNNFVKVGEAIDVVMELASEGLERLESNGLETNAECDAKQEAIDTIHDFFVNVVFKDDDVTVS